MRCPSLALPASLLALVLLAGCSADAEPAAGPPGSPPTDSAAPSAPGSSAATPDASPSASPSASAASGSPVPTRAPAGESAEAFIRRWLALEVEMERSGETSAYDAVSNLCSSCRATSERVRDIYSAGGRVEPGGETVLGIQELPSKAGTQTFRVEVSVRPTRYQVSSSAKPQRFKGGRSAYKVSVRRGSRGWNVIEFAVFTRLP